jgi:hypothetical protein
LDKGYIGFGTSPNDDMDVEYVRFAKIQSRVSIKPDHNPKIISQWNISQAFPIMTNANNVAEMALNLNYPETKRLKSINWRNVSADYDGILNISSIVKSQDSIGNTNFIYAKTEIFSDTSKAVEMVFGYCDISTVYLNGKLVFSGFIPLKGEKDYYRASMNNKILLNLEPGKNELLVVTAAIFHQNTNGGWGIYGEIDALNK